MHKRLNGKKCRKNISNYEEEKYVIFGLTLFSVAGFFPLQPENKATNPSYKSYLTDFHQSKEQLPALHVKLLNLSLRH